MWVNQTPVQNEDFSKNGWILRFYTQNADMKQLIDHVHWIRTLRTVTLYTHFSSSNNVPRNPEYKVYWVIWWTCWLGPCPWYGRYEFPGRAHCPRVLGLQTVNLSMHTFEAKAWMHAAIFHPQTAFTLGQGGLQNNIYLSGTLVLVSVVKRVWTEITRCALWRWPASHLQHWQSPHRLMTWKQLCWDWWLRCCFIGCPL